MQLLIEGLDAIKCSQLIKLFCFEILLEFTFFFCCACSVVPK